MAQFEDTWQKSSVIALNFEHQSRVLIDCPSCQRSMNSQSNEIIPRRPCMFKGWCSLAGNLKGLSLRFAHQTSRYIRQCRRWQVTSSQKSQSKLQKNWGHHNVTSKERQKWTQFPIFHEWLFTVIDSMFYNDIWELWHTANNTLVIFLGRNDMLNLATVKVHVNSTVRKGTIKLQTSQSTRFLAVKVIKWMETHLPVYSVNFGGTWSYLHSQFPS